MSSIRDYIDPGGKMLAYHLTHLCETLENLGARLRGTIANAIGETIAIIIRDTALRLLGDVSHYLPSSDSISAPWRRRDMLAQSSSDERDYWDDDDYDDTYEAAREGRFEPAPPPGRLSTALSAGLQAASWWLRRWSGRKNLITTMAIGLLATGAAFIGGPLVLAVIGLAHAATHFTSMSGALAARNQNSN